MASKLQLITDLYNEQLERVTQSPAEWMAFLQAAARNYKLPFDEQLLVYAQRPNATAVLEMERWNEHFGRWVNQGSTGIAVFDRTAAHPKLKYYFDIEDTHETLFSRPVPLWEMQPDFVPDVIEHLENSFGELADTETLAAALLSVADNLAADNLPDYYDQLVEMGVEIEESAYFLALQNSVAHMLMTRCGVEQAAPEFSTLAEFNTPAAVNALGIAASAIAEMGLREIAAVVLPQQKNIIRTFANEAQPEYTQTIPAEERMKNHEQPDLHTSEWVQHPEPDPAAAGRQPEPLGQGAAELSADAETLDLHTHDDTGPALAAPAGDAGNSRGTTRPVDGADGAGAGRDGGTQSQQSDAMAGADEQRPAQRGGTGDAGTGLQLSFLLSPEEQIEQIEEAGAAKAAASSLSFGAPLGAPFGVPMEELDRELTRGGSYADGKYRIYKHFTDDHTPEENARFLKKRFGQGGHSPFGNSEYWVDADSKGLQFRKGNLLHPDENHLVPWPKAAQRVRDLIALDRYLTPLEKERYPDYLEELAALAVQQQKQEYIHSVAELPPEEKRDTLPLRLADFTNGLDRYEKDCFADHGLPELAESVDMQQIDALLKNPRQTQQLMDALAAIQGGTTGVFSRSNAYRFGLELVELHPRHYVYQAGDSVYINGSRDIAYADERVVRLANPEFPLLSEEFSRDAFEQQLRESPQNNRFLVLVDTDEPSQTAETPRMLYKKYLPSLLEELRVSDIYSYLRDRASDADEAAHQIGEWLDEFSATPSEDYPGLPDLMRLPSAREWLIEDILDQTYQDAPQPRGQLEQNELRRDAPDWAKRSPESQPGYEEWSEPTTKDNAPDHPGEPSDDIAAYLPNAEPETPFELPVVGDRYEIQGRLFVVDSVSEEWESVGLRDVTFEGGTGFPIFRRESLDFMRQYDPIREEPVPEPAAHPPVADRHNFHITDDNLGHGGAKAKFRMNADAISLLRDLELEQRLATPAEQEILSRYVGWGGIPQAFDPDNAAWEAEYLELNALLAPDEFTAARASTLNAHYTSPTVIKAIYTAIENMGFTRGNVLEPSCGIGNFFGLLPESMSASKLYGVELDPITGRIAQQLYQNSNIAIQGFETTNLPDSFFDLAIGNVPFGDYALADRRYDKQHFHIHDYFFAKTLDKVRPGGVVAFVTSKYTMDKQNPAVRKYIAQHAELLGAIRLPNTAFKANAGTDVTADILFLQKRDHAIEIEPEWVHLGQTEDGIPINSYFVENPEMMLGEMTTESTRYGHDTTCRPYPDRDLTSLLAEAVQNINANIPDYERDDLAQETEAAIPADPAVRNFSYTIYNSGVYYRENSIMLPQEFSATARSRIKGMIGIRDSARRLITLQTEDAPDSEIQQEQAKLNRLYDTYTAKYGLLSDRANATVFREDGSYPLLCSLEVLDADGKLKAKADMFRARTIRPHVPVTHVDSSADALAVSIAEKARVDLVFMEQLSGKSEENLAMDLAGAIFQEPVSGEWQTADEYLSGNVREKLAQAKEYADTNPAFEVNVKALEAAQPKDLTAAEISVRLGATWVPTEDIQQFVYELLKTPWHSQYNIKVHYSQYTAEWSITSKSMDKNSIEARLTYGTERISAYHILEQTLNLRTVRVFDTVIDNDGKEKRVLNPKETAIAQGKQEIIKAKFVDWVWEQPERRERLCGIYNTLYNSTRPREYDGSHINFVGMNPEIRLDAHQANAVARKLYGGNSLYGHVVGAGKTYTMIAAAMESKRLGLSNKALFVVPNNIVGQFSAEFLQLYPSANVLMVTARDFEKRNRRKFCARIATGDYDGIVMAHSQFEKIPMSVEWQEDFLRQQVDDINDGIAEMKEQNGERMTIKQMERARKSLQVKIQKLNDQSRKDDMLTFEELGVDFLCVDEADLFKNLMLITKMRNVAGIGQSDAQKASDLFMKTRYLDEITGGRGVVFATGTPVSNTMAEMYTMQRYLQYDTLKMRGLEHFDCWASTFGETVTAMELAPEGTGFRMKTRFARFYNLPELMNMFREVADIQTKDMLNLPTPTVHFRTVTAKPSEQQKAMVQSLAERAGKIRNREVDPRTDNMLLVTNDGRKLALDQRLINPLLPDFPGSKVNLCVENVHRIWQDTAEKRLTQLVFIDLSTPKDGIEFDVYHDIKEKLLLRGVPADEIAFIHEAKNEAQKQALFGRVRTGAVRVLLGSTAKMGAGTNVQNLIIASHDLDCPWRPRDLEQRLGRTERRGNTNAEVELYRYVTEQTFDAYLYQIIENKQKFISQVFTSKSPARVMQDVDEAVLNYAEVKALATGDPRIMELCTLEAEVGKLKLLKSSFMNERYALQDSAMKYLPAQISRVESEIRGFESDAALAAQTSPASTEHFAPMVVEGKTYATTKDAGFAILEACKATASKEPVPLGEYRGFQLEVSFDMWEKHHVLHIIGQIRHKIDLGIDARGNISRIDNALTDLPKELRDKQNALKEARQQLAVALAEKDKPFAQETELDEKSARLAELTTALQINEREPEILADDVPDEGDGADAPHRKKPARER